MLRSRGNEVQPSFYPYQPTAQDEDDLFSPRIPSRTPSKDDLTQFRYRNTHIIIFVR